MSDEALHAHSLAEVRLYLRVAPCAQCGKGPLRLEGAPRRVDNETLLHEICISCSTCAATWSWSVELIGDRPGGAPSDEVTINPSSEPSRIIDLGQWLVLVSLLLDEVTRESNKTHARELGLSAARCLDEALKFYTDEDNDLPPPEAFFDAASQRRFRESPEQFSRQRVAGLKSGLPRPYPNQ